MSEPKRKRPAGEPGERVTEAFHQVEGAATGGYARIEDAFVERYLAREGETVEEAKRRLKGAGGGDGR